MASAANDVHSHPFHELNASLVANVCIRAIKGNLASIKMKVKVTANDFRKHANVHYSEWFHKKPGHEEAKLELKHLCDVIRNHTEDCWDKLLDSIQKRVFFIHIVYTYILEIREQELCSQVQSDIYQNLEQILQTKEQLFRELAMTSLQRRAKICSAVLRVMKDDALAEDYSLTIHHGIPLMRATEEAYGLLKKHFPNSKITKESNLESLLEIMEGEIVTIEKNLLGKTQESQDKEQRLDMMRLVANQLRRQLEEKECQFQKLMKKMDGIDITMKKVLDGQKRNEKINNIQAVSTSTTLPKEAEVGKPEGEIEVCGISRVVVSGSKDKDMTNSGSM